MLILSFLLHLWQYGLNLTYETTSNALFIIGVIMFLPALVAVTQAYYVFNGIRYAFRVIINPKFRQEYPQYSDYRDERSEKIKTSLFAEMLITSGTLIVAAIILARFAMR